MALSINTASFTRAQARLSQSQRGYKRRLLRDMEEMGKLIERYARAMAPYETGSLERAIYYKLNRNDYSKVSISLYISGSRVRAKVGNSKRNVTVGDYAEYMISGAYALGPGSLIKQQSVDVLVGNKFLERGARRGWWRFEEKLIESARLSGFSPTRSKVL